jgi:hypothetical protein
MKTKTITVTRRQVLRGAAGFTLGLPFLPSIVPVKAYSANIVSAPRKYFAAFVTDHGGILGSNFWPSSSMLLGQKQLVPGHIINYGPLAPTMQNGTTYLSNVLQAQSTLLTPRMVSKMNVLNGLDQQWMVGHNVSAHLGHLEAPNNYNVVDPTNPTSDQAIAYSTSFYTDMMGVRMRSVQMGGYYNGQSTSYFFSDPVNRTGGQQQTNYFDEDPMGLFNALFGTGVSPGGMPPAQRPLIVDRVLQDYRALRNGNARLSTEDRQRLDDHLARLDELQRSLIAQQMQSQSAACASPMTGSGMYSDMNSIVAMAFICGYTRVASFGCPIEDFYHALPPGKPSDGGDYHNNVAHRWWDPTNQSGIILPSWQLYFQNVLDFVQKIDVPDGSGSTILDNALVFMTSECSEVTHYEYGIPVVTFGNAGGGIVSGQYVDYRNLSAMLDIDAGGAPNYPPVQTGLPWCRVQATLCQAMGLARSEYENPGPGYGNLFSTTDYTATQAPGLTAFNGDFLPVIGIGG